MSRAPQDHEIKFLVDAATYLALRHEAEADDRSVGGLLRHLVHSYLSQRARASEQPEPGQTRPESVPE